MYNFLEDILEEALSHFDGEDTTSVLKSLFYVEDLPLISEELMNQFHIPQDGSKIHVHYKEGKTIYTSCNGFPMQTCKYIEHW